jgi:hypothetical protein
MFAALAEFERDVIRERTIAGLAAARARGRKGGRKNVFTMAKLRTAQASPSFVRNWESRASLYNYVTASGGLTDRDQALLAK